MDDRVYHNVVRAARKHFPGSDADHVHDAWIELKNESFQVWFGRAKQRAIDEYRRRCRWSSAEFVDRISVLEAENEVQTPEMLAIREETRRVVDAAVRKLPPRDARLVRMHFWGQLSPAQIAADTGIRLKTVYTRLARAVARLKTVPQIQHLEEAQ